MVRWILTCITGKSPALLHGHHSLHFEIDLAGFLHFLPYQGPIRRDRTQYLQTIRYFWIRHVDFAEYTSYEHERYLNFVFLTF